MKHDYFNSLKMLARTKNKHIKFSNTDTGEMELVFCPVVETFSSVESVLRNTGLDLICTECGFILE